MRGSDRETPTTRLPKQQEDQKGNRGERRRWHHPPRPWPSEEGRGGGGCSSLRVRGWMWLTMISRGVEISIARGVEEMVRGVEEMVRGVEEMVRAQISCPEGALI